MSRVARPGRSQHRLSMRPHVVVDAAVTGGAEAEGISVGRYIETVLAHAMGLPQYAPTPWPEHLPPIQQIPAKITKEDDP